MVNVFSTKNQYDAIPIILDTITGIVEPVKIVLFGSCARKCVTQNSDIDICVVLKDKITIKERVRIRAKILERLIELTDFEVDIYICSKEDWNSNYQDRTTFIGKISNEGEILYG